MSKPIHYPLLFNYKDCIAGDGFLASVVVSGRALMFNEDDEWWMHGVQPAAISEAGETPQEAAAHFRKRYRTVLFDFSAEASGFEAFRTEVERFFNQPEPEISASWQTAFELIRSGKVDPGAPFSRLPRQAPEAHEPEIDVFLVDPAALSPNDNVLDRELIAA
jgi:hypothetical protein